ncbi:MAG: NAD-dependent deacylase [Bacteroidota bacterium]|nr:NAD-dependent deacylase [Bacteroidota bacterium]
MKKQKIVVLTGAGISAESGIPTFRDAGGLWEGHDIMEVASPEGWRKNRDVVLDFYNQRRKAIRNVQPNAGHYELARLEEKYDVLIITQNIDDLHERAGSTNVLHLHGEIFKSQSSGYPELVYDLGDKDIHPGDKCEKGTQLRPFIVWFGEAVPMIEQAMHEAMKAEIFLVVGTSLVVYPAAGLLDYIKESVPKYIIDPNIPEGIYAPGLVKIQMKASAGVKQVADLLMGE